MSGRAEISTIYDFAVKTSVKSGPNRHVQMSMKSGSVGPDPTQFPQKCSMLLNV